MANYRNTLDYIVALKDKIEFLESLIEGNSDFEGYINTIYKSKLDDIDRNIKSCKNEFEKYPLDPYMYVIHNHIDSMIEGDWSDMDKDWLKENQEYLVNRLYDKYCLFEDMQDSVNEIIENIYYEE